MKYLRFFLLNLCMAALPMVQLYASTPADPRAATAEALAQQMYCDATGLISGDVGILIGLGLSAAGVVTILFQGVTFSSVVFIAGGLLLTAIPSFFNGLLASLGQIFDGLGGNNPSGAISC